MELTKISNLSDLLRDETIMGFVENLPVLSDGGSKFKLEGLPVNLEFYKDNLSKKYFFDVSINFDLTIYDNPNHLHLRGTNEFSSLYACVEFEVGGIVKRSFHNNNGKYQSNQMIPINNIKNITHGLGTMYTHPDRRRLISQLGNDRYNEICSDFKEFYLSFYPENTCVINGKTSLTEGRKKLGY